MARTKEESREYMRAYRAKKSGEPPAGKSASVTDIGAPRTRPQRPANTPADKAVESVVQSVRRELELMPHAATQPGIVAIILACAQVMDDDDAIPQRASNAKVMTDLMTKLRGAEVSGGNKLSQLRSRRFSEGKSA